MSDYNQEKECAYNGERYSVRDNGQVLRHPRKDKRKRPLDNKWMFESSISGGYCRIGSEYVHKIVATAFHGEQPASWYVVDHIDTNRRNNRPENLRWVPRLKNILNNPITRAKIEHICGSVEAFLKNPSLLKNHESDNQDLSWMRNVTSEEAQNFLERMKAWANKENRNSSPGRFKMGEWVYEEFKSKSLGKNSNEDNSEVNELMESKTPGAVQKNWKVPSEFPLCPPEMNKNSLDQYLQNLKTGEIFARNEYVESTVHSADYSKDSKSLLVICSLSSGPKKWSLARISTTEKKFIHESIGTFFSVEGAQKQFTLGQGLTWEGGDSIDDYC